jgi:hypothetical protein
VASMWGSPVRVVDFDVSKCIFDIHRRIVKA